MLRKSEILADITPNTGNKAEPVTSITDLRFGWNQGAAPIIDIGSLQVERGERIFVMGESGSGKSTLLSLITGILIPQKGEVKVLGENISALSGIVRDRYRSDRIGYIFQMFNLIPYLSVVENVILPCQFSSARKNKALTHSSSLQEEAIRLLKQLNIKGSELLNKKVTELSVGQQQRVAAARALIGSPEIVIADEPTSSLDADHREFFLQLLFKECSDSGASLIFVSHDRELSSHFDTTINMKEINSAAHAGERVIP